MMSESYRAVRILISLNCCFIKPQNNRGSGVVCVLTEERFHLSTDHYHARFFQILNIKAYTLKSQVSHSHNKCENVCDFPSFTSDVHTEHHSDVTPREPFWPSSSGYLFIAPDLFQEVPHLLKAVDKLSNAFRALVARSVTGPVKAQAVAATPGIFKHLL